MANIPSQGTVEDIRLKRDQDLDTVNATKIQKAMSDKRYVELDIGVIDTAENVLEVYARNIFEDAVNSGVLGLNDINEAFSDPCDRKVKRLNAKVDENFVLTVDCSNIQTCRDAYTIALLRAKQIAVQAGQNPKTAPCGKTRSDLVSPGGGTGVGTAASKIIVSGGPDLPGDETGNADIGSDFDRQTGIIPKKDRRASLSITPVTGAVNFAITNFFITSIREEDNEKFQIVETFGTNFLFFYGRRPRIYVVSGILANGANMDWKNEFKQNYDNVFRGTQLTKARRRAVFTYEDVQRQGYLLNFSHQLSAENPHSIPFSFSFFVTNESKLAESVNNE